jgi:uncharacterized protein YndB with AHSA1/START domain
VPEPPSATRTFAHEISIDAPPEAVFPYFTDPARLVRWMGSDATLDPRPGGVFRVNFSREIGDASVVGEFVEVVPYSRVVFAWGWEGELFGVPPKSTLVEVSLVRDGDRTRVRLVHSDLPGEAVEAHSAGWLHYLQRLSAVATGGEPVPDEWIAPGLSAPDASV